MRFFLFIFLSAFLTSCGAYVETNVSSFSNLPSTVKGETFYILSTENQNNSVEFDTYASSISKRLKKAGWFRINNPDEAKYFVMLDYGVSGSTTKTGSVPIYGQTGGGTTTSHSGSFNTYGYGGSNYGSYSGSSYTMPTYGIVGSQSYSYTDYQRYFMMKIIDKINEKPVYETKVASEGSNAQFGPVAECIFDAALENFPHASTENSVLLMDDCGKY